MIGPGTMVWVGTVPVVGCASDGSYVRISELAVLVVMTVVGRNDDRRTVRTIQVMLPTGELVWVHGWVPSSAGNAVYPVGPRMIKGRHGTYGEEDVQAGTVPNLGGDSA